MNIIQEIRNRIVFCDGGMGSLLQARGLKPGELPETWNVLHPENLVEIHREYIERWEARVAVNGVPVNDNMWFY